MPQAEMSSPATGVDSFQPVIAPPNAFSSTPKSLHAPESTVELTIDGAGSQSMSQLPILWQDNSGMCSSESSNGISPQLPRVETCLAIYLVLAFFPSLSCLPQLCFLGSLPK